MPYQPKSTQKEPVMYGFFSQTDMERRSSEPFRYFLRGLSRVFQPYSIYLDAAGNEVKVTNVTSDPNGPPNKKEDTVSLGVLVKFLKNPSVSEY